MKELMQGLRDSSIKAILEADDIELNRRVDLTYDSARDQHIGRVIERTLSRFDARQAVLGECGNRVSHGRTRHVRRADGFAAERHG